MIPNYNGMPGSSEATRKTEILALRELPPNDRRDLDAVRMALQTIQRYRNADDRYMVIDLVYWRRSHTIEGAALKVHISPERAGEWDRDFIGLVDAYRRR